MRIVYVLTSLGMGGAERQVLALAGRMAAQGHRVSLLVLKSRLGEEWPSTLEVVYLNLGRTPMSLVIGLMRARRFLIGFRPHLLHSHSFHANLFARLLTVIAPGHRLICTIHNIWEGGWARMLAYRMTDGLSQKTTAVCTAAALRFISLKAISQTKCLVLSNGIDVTEFFPQAKRRAQTRAQMGVNEEFIWLAAGRIAPAKDYPNLLRAFARVTAACPQAQLWIAGEAAGTEFKRVSGLTVELGLGDRARWLGLRHDIPALLDAADGFVSSSAWEGMPLAVGEAMAMEKPVVATDVGGVRELLDEAGVMVPPKDPDALAAAMLELIRRKPEDRRVLGCQARERIVSKFSMNARADEWEVLYRTI